MRRIRMIAALMGTAAIGLPLLASGQQPDIGKEMDVGKREYDAIAPSATARKAKATLRMRACAGSVLPT